MRSIVVLGSTGSIGRQTLDVVSSLPEQFTVVGLAAGRNVELLAQQVEELHPRLVWADASSEEKSRLTSSGASFASMEEMVRLPEVDLVMAATTGCAGLGPTLEALRLGKSVALANKEVIVMAGELVTAMACRHGGRVLPVDSEPSAIWQCLQGEEQPVSSLILTASGGPFRSRPLEEMAGATPAEALQHPTWSMGRKITIDSATLMNKGFEVIESHWLFQVPWECIRVVVHPQSIIHSMVEFADGSVKGQMGLPDMRLPIQYALLYPQRIANQTLPRFDPLQFSSLTFEPLDPERYPCFTLAVEAGRSGGTYPAVLSGADEEAVRLFLEGRIGFGEIHTLVAETLQRHQRWGDGDLEAILEADAWARRQVLRLVDGS